MKALVLRESLELSNSYPLPSRKPGEALIRVRRSAICNTDLEVIKGYMGFHGVVGHEFVGEIAEVDDNPKVNVGQRVVGEINTACEKCDYCEVGGFLKRNHCRNRSAIGIEGKDGSHAEFLTLQIGGLYPVPDSVTDQQARFVEPLAAAFRIVEQGLVKPTDKVALIGDGKLAQMIGQVIQSLPKGKFVVFGKHLEKLGMLGESQETSLVNETTAEKFRDTFDVVIDACGSPTGLVLAQEITRPLGTIVLKTTCLAGPTFNTASYVVKELTIVGSRCGNFAMALEALEKGTVTVDHLVHRVFPLQQAMAAIEEAGKKGVLKVQITMG